MAVTFDMARFREAVAYIAWRMRDDPNFGRLKMAKTLFYVDFDAFAESGEAVTGAEYRHWPFGPFPPALYHVERELVASGEADLKNPEHEGDTAKLIGKREPATPHLHDWHRVALDLKMNELAEKGSWRVSDESHEHPGWVVTRDQEEIPYTAALAPAEPSAGAFELARRRFGGHGRSSRS